jgi:hypothetical protein
MVYASAAERQKAYRERNALTASEPKTPGKIRKASRPARLRSIESEIQVLLREYEEWAGRLPDSLESTAQADCLAETIERLEIAAQVLEEIQPPLGFGRD